MRPKIGIALGSGAALKTRMESFSKADVAALLDVRLATGGLIEGKRIEDFLDSLGIRGSIEAFAPRYGAVATELASGREVWLQEGPVWRAVRASIGMPGVFSPTRNEEDDGTAMAEGGVRPGIFTSATTCPGLAKLF